jgi:translation initiation factor 4E
MSLESQNTDEKILNDSWILWYHDPNDLNWDLASYKQVSEIKTISDFWNTYEFIQNNIIENSMFFIMREGIEPLWEDPQNVNGGCWSFKIPKGNIKKYWAELSIYLLGENITKREKLVNGLSISPKKTFCIIKIWNNDKNSNDKNLINKKMDIPFDSCIYKQHK